MTINYEKDKWYKIQLKEPILGLDRKRYSEVLGSPNTFINSDELNSNKTFSIMGLDGNRIPGEGNVEVSNVSRIIYLYNKEINNYESSKVSSTPTVSEKKYIITLKTPIKGYDEIEHTKVIGISSNPIVSKSFILITDLNGKIIPGESHMVVNENVESIKEMDEVKGGKRRTRRIKQKRRSVRNKK
jgi:hypothetical protein